MASDSKIGPISGLYKSKKLGVASVIFGFSLVAAGQHLAEPWIYVPSLAAATLVACVYIYAQAKVEAASVAVEEDAAAASPAPVTSTTGGKS